MVFACGCSFSYQPSLVILGHYFRRRLGLVNGIVTAGSSIFTIVLPFVLSGLLARVGLPNTMRLLCILLFVLMLAGFSYKPLLPAVATSASAGCRWPPLNQVFNFNIWRSAGYRIWAFGIPAALYGYFVPYVHLVSRSTVEFILFVLLLLLICAQRSKGPSDKGLDHIDAADDIGSTCPQSCCVVVDASLHNLVVVFAAFGPRTSSLLAPETLARGATVWSPPTLPFPAPVS